METKICLDTDVVIEILNKSLRAKKIIDSISQTKIYITNFTLFELLQRKNNLEQIDFFRSKVNLLIFDEEASRTSSKVYKELENKGKMNNLIDTFIAGTCISNNCPLLTFNKKHFKEIKDLKLI